MIFDVATLTASTFTAAMGGTSGTTISAAATGNLQDVTAVNTTGMTFTATATSAGTIDNAYVYKFRRLDAKFRLRVYYLREGRYTGRRN
jgi:hypothetical protein